MKRKKGSYWVHVRVPFSQTNVNIKVPKPYILHQMSEHEY